MFHVRSLVFITVLCCDLSFATEMYHPYFNQFSQIWESKKWRHVVCISHFCGSFDHRSFTFLENFMQAEKNPANLFCHDSYSIDSSHCHNREQYLWSAGFSAQVLDICYRFAARNVTLSQETRNLFDDFQVKGSGGNCCAVKILGPFGS